MSECPECGAENSHVGLSGEEMRHGVTCSECGGWYVVVRRWSNESGSLARCEMCGVTFGPEALVGHLVEVHDLDETPELAPEFVEVVGDV